MMGATHPRCRSRFAPDGLTTCFRYEGIVKKAIKFIKYRLCSDMVADLVSCIGADLIGTLSAVMARQDSGHDAIIVPVPLHPGRKKYRGFNQAEVIADAVGRTLSVPVRTDILFRVRHTGTQADIRTRSGRIRNMHNAFGVREDIRLGSLRVVLVDDVVTTGATLRSAVSALKRHGVRWVWALTLAR